MPASASREGEPAVPTVLAERDLPSRILTQEKGEVGDSLVTGTPWTVAWRSRTCSETTPRIRGRYPSSRRVCASRSSLELWVAGLRTMISAGAPAPTR